MVRRGSLFSSVRRCWRCHPGGRASRGRSPGDHVVEPVTLLLETCQQRAFEHPATRQLDLHRIDKAAVDQDLIMQMRTGRRAGWADIADPLSLPYLLALLHVARERRHVAI